MKTRQEMQFVRVCDCGCGQPTMIRNHNAPSAGRVKGQPARYAHGGGRVRFAPDPSMWTEAENGCWLPDVKPNSYGYSEFRIAGRMVKAHRAVFELYRGPIPADLQLDHLCRNRACVNPDHLEPVTQTTNVRRGLRAKLTIQDARAIRASGEHYTVLMQRYGVSKATIHKVRAGTAWVDDDTKAAQ